MPPIHDAELWQTRLAALPLESYEAGETVFAEGTKTGRLLILQKRLGEHRQKRRRDRHGCQTRRRVRRTFGAARRTAQCRCACAGNVGISCRGRRRVSGARPGGAALCDGGPGAAHGIANRAFFELKQQLAAGEPQGLIDATLDKMEGVARRHRQRLHPRRRRVFRLPVRVNEQAIPAGRARRCRISQPRKRARRRRSPQQDLRKAGLPIRSARDRKGRHLPEASRVFRRCRNRCGRWLSALRGMPARRIQSVARSGARRQ